MNLTFTSYGAAECVAGSKHLLCVDDYNLLVDIGYEYNAKQHPLGFDPKELDALVLTHGHADHVGRLHELVYQGFSNPIYCHPATRDLCRIQLEETLITSMRRNRKVKQRDIEAAKKDIEAIISSINVVPYGQETMLAPNIKRCTLDAGHLIGSEEEIFTIDEKIKVCFSGDLGRTDADIPFTRKPECLPRNLDFFVLEGTYGTKMHSKTRSIREELMDFIMLASKQGGKLVFPIFSIQRTQHLLVYLFQLYESGNIPRNMKIVLDSPSAEKVNAIIIKHLDSLDEKTRKLFADSHYNPFLFPALEYTRNAQESIALGSRRTPTIIVTSSGMCNGGRIENYFADIIQDKRNVLVLTSYQAKGTKGSYLANGAKEIYLHRRKIPINAFIGRIHGFSGHSDCKESIAYLRQSNDPLAGEDFAGIFLVHGDKQNLYDLKQELDTSGFRNVIVAEKGKAYDLMQMYRRFHNI